MRCDIGEFAAVFRFCSVFVTAGFFSPFYWWYYFCKMVEIFHEFKAMCSVNIMLLHGISLQLKFKQFMSASQNVIFMKII
jgi:hypothetical protein